MWMSMRSRSGPEIFGDVALNHGRGAHALARLVVEVAAGAGVHGGGEHEARGEAERHGGACDGDGVVFERLAEDFEDVAGKFGEFVEEENAVVRHGDFAGARDDAAADETCVGDGVMRRAEWALGDEACCGSSTPATEWIFVVSSASSNVSGARMEGRRLASMVLPEPGGPIMRMLWEPAAATSSARLAVCWPRTSRKSVAKCSSSPRSFSVSTRKGGRCG